MLGFVSLFMLRAYFTMSNMSKIRIEYEDEHLLVVYKPSGVLSQGDKSGEASIVDHVASYLKTADQKESICRPNTQVR